MQKFHRVKILADNQGLQQISEAGVCIDHGEHKNNCWLITVISETELNTIHQLGYSAEILINDIEKFYNQQNVSAQKNGFPAVLNSVGCFDNCQAWPQPQNFALGSFAGFFTLQEVMDNLDSMAAKFPSIISLRQSVGSGTTTQGRTIYYVKISDNPGLDESEPEILYNSLHHAREAQSISQLIYFMWYLLENYGSDPAITYLINQTEMYFVPVANPDGYVYNYTTNPNGGGMWRKNRRNNGDGTFGVDLNRNYGYNWGFNNTGSSPTTSSDTYRGPFANSEPETQLMENFINSHDFKLSVNNHTYSDVLIYPFGYAPNLETPDSLQFKSYAEQMTNCNGFEFGTPNQTVGYSANGAIDDWLYADTSLHQKVLSFTPEAGAASDGFWPNINRIIPIAQNTMAQNMEAAKLISQYALSSSTDELFVSALNTFAHYEFKRLGMQSGTFTVTLLPISTNIGFTGAPKVYTNPALLQSFSDSISVTLSGVNPGDVIQYGIVTNNGFYNQIDTVTRYFGTPITAFTDNCNSISPKWSSTTWGPTTSQFISPAASLSESPSGNYPNNSTRILTSVNFIDLTDALAARLSFSAKWAIEAQYDYLQVQASTDGINWTGLCGKYTNTGTAYQDPGHPVYDGIKAAWINEEIDLSTYSGQSMKLRYYFKSDGGTNMDGIYIENVLIEKITAINTTSATEDDLDVLTVFPNPIKDILSIKGLENNNQNNFSIEIIDVTGKKIANVNPNELIGGNGIRWCYGNGFYLIKISDENGKVSTFRIAAAE